MAESTTQIVIPVAYPQQPAKSKLSTLFTAAYLIMFQCVHYILTPASLAISVGFITFVAPLRHLWGHYYRRVELGEGRAATPHSALTFIISVLLALVEIKSQSLPGFPFQTHPHTIMFFVSSLLIYGLASAAELIVSFAGLDLTSIYAIAAHLGKIVSLCILVISLASLFLFYI